MGSVVPACLELPLLDPQVAGEVDYAIASSLVSRAGATATSNSPANGPLARLL